MIRRWIVTLIGIVLMGVSVYGYSQYAARMDAEVKTTTTIKPARLIVSGEVIDASMLRSVTVPMDAVQSGALADPNHIIGKTAAITMGAEEQIFEWKLADDPITPGERQRYISFKTDDVTNVGNMIRKGDRVDVWVEFTEPRDIGGKWTGSVKIIEGLRVASVKTAEGTEVADSAVMNFQFQDSGRQHEKMRSAATGKPEINTFIMSEEVYEAFAFARLIGTIKLALPDLSIRSSEEARLTDDFTMLKRIQFTGDER